MTATDGPATREDDAPHAVALYDSEESLGARVVPYLREGLDRGETVVAVVSDAAEQIVRSALGGDADRVQWRAGEVSYHRLGAMFEGFRQFLADQRAAGARMRLLTENDVGGGPDRLGAYLRNEAMTNEVYRPYGFPWACLYDRRAHTEETLRQVREVHPRLLEPGGGSIRSSEYVTPGDFVARGARLLPVPAVVELDLELTGPGELVTLRRLLARWVGGHGVKADDADDVLIAVSEAVTNALQHGAPPVRVQAFTLGGAARVRVHDPGSAAVFATAGYHRPDTAGGSGIGLWVARQLADVVTTHTDTTGTTVELSFPMTGRP